MAQPGPPQLASLRHRLGVYPVSPSLPERIQCALKSTGAWFVFLNLALVSKESSLAVRRGLGDP